MRHLMLLFVLALFACSQEAPKKSAGPTEPTPPPPAKEAEGPPAVELPAEDFDGETEQAVTAENYKEVLDEIEAEIDKADD